MRKILLFLLILVLSTTLLLMVGCGALNNLINATNNNNANGNIQPGTASFSAKLTPASTSNAVYLLAFTNDPMSDTGTDEAPATMEAMTVDNGKMTKTVQIATGIYYIVAFEDVNASGTSPDGADRLYIYGTASNPPVMQTLSLSNGDNKNVDLVYVGTMDDLNPGKDNQNDNGNYIPPGNVNGNMPPPYNGNVNLNGYQVKLTVQPDSNSNINLNTDTGLYTYLFTYNPMVNMNGNGPVQVFMNFTVSPGQMGPTDLKIFNVVPGQFYIVSILDIGNNSNMGPPGSEDYMGIYGGFGSPILVNINDNLNLRATPIEIGLVP